MPFNIDLHTHTFFSGDGVSSPEDLIASARAKGLHGVAITDHNTCDAIDYLLGKKLMREDGLPVEGFLIIPGVEVTTAEGHLLCVGKTLPHAARSKAPPPPPLFAPVHDPGRPSHPPHPHDLFPP